jgi:7,8-dihydropterin-6-yl-methyl-4-(beta-D-ribofuranosyl)aminobenzene 5'-phosphate synthase
MPLPREKTTEIAPGMRLIATVSDKPTTLELRELSLAIDKIVEAAAAIDPRIHLIAGGLHLVVAKDVEIDGIVATLRDRFKVAYIAPGHCTGEPTFAALQKAFGGRYLYAGLGTALALGATPHPL